MRKPRQTKEYPKVGSYEFEAWAKQTLDEIHTLVENYRKERLEALNEFMDFLEKETGNVRCGEDCQRQLSLWA